MRTKKPISVIIVIAMILSMLPTFSAMAEDGTYTCDFTGLVKDSADTPYGTSTDIYKLDEYTRAHLTYEGTYVGDDGKVYLTGGAAVNAAGKYKQGSYVAFTAPVNGTVSVTGNRIGYCVGNESADTYVGYGNAFKHELKAGEMIFMGQRSDTYISTLTFTKAPEETPVPTDDPNVPDEPSRQVLYQENFETYSDGENGGWTSPAGSVKIKTDLNSAIKKYLTVTSGSSGTARSGYKEITEISENFVLEADVKSTAYATNVSAFEVLEKTSSLYMNHGCYSNGKYIFKMNRPAGLNKYVINNSISDSGMSLDRYAKPTVVTNDIPNEWIRVKVVGNFTDHTATSYITSLDRKTVYYKGRTDMSSDINSFKLLTLLAPSSGVDTCIDNIKVSKALAEDLSEVFHTVTIDDRINKFSQYVCSGSSVTNIPDVSVYGKYFLGWNVNGVLKSELSTLPITENTTITASISPDYIENLASVEFNSFPTDNQLVMGDDGDTYADNQISLTITGERGTSIVLSPDSRAKDYKIDWAFDGLRIMNGNPTGESGSFPGTQLYCDSYGRVTVDKKAQTSVNFELKNTSANYYGIVKATVTYNGKTITVSKPLLLLADTSNNSNVILPKMGYTADFNKYDNKIVGYRASSNDILLGGWSTAGSDTGYIELASDTTGKYLSFSRALGGNSSYFYQQIGDIKSQTVFEQDIRFGMSGSIVYGTGKTVTEITSTAFELGFLSAGFTFNGNTVCAGDEGKWYHIKITADPTTKIWYANIYNLKSNGDYSTETPIGTTDTISFRDGYTSGNYYRINIAKERDMVDINNVVIRKAQTEESTIAVTMPQTINIPENGTATADFTVTAKTDDGENAIGMATWEIADEFATGVSITSTGAGSAVLTVDNTASSGELNIKVTINDKSVIKTIKLVGTKDNIAFVRAPVGVRIPANGSSEYTYKAEVRGGNSETVSGRNITYMLYNESNTAPLTASGITISSDGKITITSSAMPQTACVTASSTDAEGNPISKTIKVNIYSLKFDFGTNTPENGFTSVSSNTVYSDNRGFGVIGSASDNTSIISGSDFGFSVKLEKGNVYKVAVTYKGTIRCERIDSKLTGFERKKDSLSEDIYNVAVFGDGIMDLTFSGAGEIDKISIENVERESNAKPAWWTIGDSTIQQNGSWAYTIASSETTDLSKYPKLAQVVSSFYNSGRAGRQHRSYYTEGLMNNVLSSITVGDVVSISNMGTNDSSSTKEEFKKYNNDYIDAIEDMGGHVILGSYTPAGNYGATEGKVYDSDRILFKGTRNNSYDTAIREVYAERVAAGDTNIIGFVDTGRLADNMMSNDVRGEYNASIDNGNSAATARQVANAKAQELMAMWKDYNHYYDSFSNYILPSLTNRFAQVIAGENQEPLPTVIELKESSVSSENTIKVISTKFNDGYLNVKIDSGFDGAAVVAMYDAVGVLKQVLTTTDNTLVKEFKLTQPSDITGYTVKIMNWNSLEGMKPYGDPIKIPLSEIADTSIEITSVDEYIDVSTLKMYDSTMYRMYSLSGSTDVKAENGKVHNTTGGEVTIVPVYRFEFTNTSSSTDENINGYVKVEANSYTEAKGYGLTNADYSINENGCKPVAETPIKADVPNGYYDIAVYRKGGARADIYNNEVLIINNSTSSSSQNRPSGSAVMTAQRMAVVGGINLAFKNLSGNNERIASLEIVRVPEKYKKPVIWVAGDSESANYYPIDSDGSDLDNAKIMMTGFGMQLGKFLSNKYAVANYGQPSATVKTWYDECFESVNSVMQSGDTILIDFGINEAASSSNGITVDEMQQYMQTIIEAARAKGVVPILISPVYNQKYQHKTYFTYSIASKQNSMYDFAEKMGVECIDLNKYTQFYTNEAITQTGDENWKTNNYHVADNLHLTQNSALLAASFIVAEMKRMGYETTDYAHTYKDISAVNVDGYTRGAESGVSRIYSVDEAQKFIFANTETGPVSVKKWDFTTDQTAVSGDNVPVVSGNVAWSGTNSNIKFDANSTKTGTLSVNLNPVIANNAEIGFDLYVGALGGQNFAYNITDTEGNTLVSCSFDKYNNTGSLMVGNVPIAEPSAFLAAISSSRGDGMTAPVTSFLNKINFDTDIVTVTIGSSVFTGSLTGAETSSVAKVEFVGSRSKTADRSVYLDNILIKEYTMIGSPSGETSFPKFKSEMFGEQNMPYRYYLPENYDSEQKYPIVMFLHGETRKGTDNESQLYNSQYLFNEIIKGEETTPCILVAPQCKASDTWTENSAYVDTLVQNISNNLKVDTDKIYLAGYGEGADGCYKLMTTGRYAAMIAISGSGDTASAQTIAQNNGGVMIMNGGMDKEEILTDAKATVKALCDAGSKNTEYVEIYGKDSNIIEDVAVKEGVIDWLFEKSLTKNAQEISKTVDLAIFMGQSNMAGRGNYVSATQVPVGHGYEFRSVTQPDMMFNMTEPFGKSENNNYINDNSGQGVDRRSGDMVSSIMSSYYSKTGVPIVGVQSSRGGTNTGYWTGSDVKAEAQLRLIAAKTYLEQNGYTVNHVFMVWCQGESDADKIHSGSQTVDGYKTSTMNIFNYMKEVGVTDMFIVQTGHYNGTDDVDGTHDAAYVSVNAAQAELAGENNNVYTVGSLLEHEKNMIDAYHYNQDAYNAVGTVAGEMISNIYSN